MKISEKISKKHKKGFLFWMEGFSGSGKTTISKKILPFVIKNFGPTIIIQGDNMRQIFELKSYTRNGRYSNSVKYRKFAKFITDQNINIIFTVVGMMKKTRLWLSKNIKNYIEIYIKADILQIKKKKIKKTYLKAKNIVGLDIKPEIPKKPDITIINNFNKSYSSLKKEFETKILELVKKNEKKFK
mgnify:CR=1 FL=1